MYFEFIQCKTYTLVLYNIYLCTWMICASNGVLLLKNVQYLLLIIGFKFEKKLLRLTMGFGYFMYSHSLVPVMDLLVRVVTKLVSEHEFSLLNFKLKFCIFLHYCGIRMICQFCHHCFLKFALCLVLAVFYFVWFVFSE